MRSTLHTRAACISLILIGLLASLVSGCASLQPGFEKPTVSLSTLEVIPGSGLAPKFAIRLHIINPNRTALALQGLVYTLEIEDQNVITGVANNLPVIAAYGSGDIDLIASADLLSGIRVLYGLMQNQQGQVNYNLSARLNVNNLLPDIRIDEQGQIDLSAALQGR